MKLELFDYNLPEELIAQTPAEQRDASKMMVLNRAGNRLEHRLSRDLPEYLEKGDLVIMNNTRVINARVMAHKADTGGKVELLLLEEQEPGQWEVLMRASRRPKPGARLVLFDGKGEAELLEDGEKGKAWIKVSSEGNFMDLVQEHGTPPLPPYIKRSAEEMHNAADQERYQTIFASEPGAVAAPTAGLHFTPELFEALDARGVERAELTLHVGIGTFRPVSTEDILDHVMDGERYEVPDPTVEKIRKARAAGKRVVAVGSTSVRTLETAYATDSEHPVCRGRSDLFIYPPYAFTMVDAMLTNFHLPKSTLLMMISALAGRDKVLDAYLEAVKERYRFFSYGDCMLIL